MTALTDRQLAAVKLAPLSEEIPAVIRNRWSPRAFLDRPVPNEQLRLVLEAATWAASSYNEQPWRFFVGHQGDATWEKIFATLGEYNKVWVKRAPVLLLCVAKTSFTHSGEANRFGMFDTGQAVATLSLAAIEFDLHLHCMAGYDADAARQAFEVPADFDMGCVIAMGYFGEHTRLEGPLLEREAMARSRKPLSESVFAETFGQSAKL